MLLARVTVWGLAVVSPAALMGQAKVVTPPNVKLCEVAKRPDQFKGKLISVRGPIQISFEDFELSVAECANRSLEGVWLEYGRGPKRQPTTWCCGDMIPVDPLGVVENDAFRAFQGYLTAQGRTSGCSEGQCYLYSVTATLTGRLDTVATLPCPDGKSQCCQGGFGHFGAFCARLVIQSVSEVVAQPTIPGEKGR
jgi:hypothetical protein